MNTDGFFWSVFIRLQEILEEVFRELHKVKDEIIDGTFYLLLKHSGGIISLHLGTANSLLIYANDYLIGKSNQWDDGESGGYVGLRPLGRSRVTETWKHSKKWF